MDGFTRWLQSASRYPVCTPRLEIELGNQIQLAARPGATPAQVRAGARARERLVQANLRLVATISRQYQARIRLSSSLDGSDLLQAGTLGLIRAVEKYDPATGYRFSTYAVWWIRQAIRREIEANESAVRISARFHQLKMKLHFAPSTLRPDQVPAYLGLTPRQYVEFQQALLAHLPHSLDQPLASSRDADDLCLAACLASPEDPSLAEAELREACSRLQAQLPQDFALIRRITSGDSQSELAREYGVSRNVISRRIERSRLRLRALEPDLRELVDAS